MPKLPPPELEGGGGVGGGAGGGAGSFDRIKLAARSPSCNAPVTVEECVLCEASPAKKILLSATGT